MARDKTTGTEQDNLQGTGQSSGSKGGSTSKDKGKLYTDAQIVKMKSDAAAEAGRLRKAAEVERDTLKQDLQSTTSRLDTLERETNESRLAEARGDPVQLRTYQREQAAAKQERQSEERERDLTKREGQVKAREEAVEGDGAVYHRAYIAAKHGLEVEDLEELGITDPEALEKVAEKLAAAKGKGEGEEGEEGEEGLELDTGETAGGAGTLEALEKANKDFAEGRITEKQLKEASDKVK